MADDVVADVFVIAWRRLEEVPEDPLPWLLGVARRVLGNRRRGERRMAALLDRLTSEQLAGRGDELVSADHGSAVLRALHSLTDRDQEVLLLVAWDGLDRQQAAAVLGVSTGAFAVRLHRARRRLVRALAAEDARADQQSSSVEVS